MKKVSAAQNRLNVLVLEGAEPRGFVQPELDWALKAGDVPYDAVGDLLSEFGLGVMRPGSSLVEVVADQVAQIDPSSALSGVDATVKVLGAVGLDVCAPQGGISRSPPECGGRTLT